MEADMIGVEHATQQFLAGRQRAKDLGRWERHVQEQAHVRAADPADDVRRRQQEMVVLHPDDVARLVQFAYFLQHKKLQ